MRKKLLVALAEVIVVSTILATTISIFGLRNVEETMEVGTQETTIAESPTVTHETETTTETVTDKAPETTIYSCGVNEPLFVEETTPEEFYISQEDIELIALVTMAEAEGESEYGKRLVIDTILNRMDSTYWPDTVSEVIWQPNQYTSVWNGRIDRCYVRDDICQLVREELVSRSNYDVVFFQTDCFSTYGQPLFQEGNHYFSSSDY